MDGVDVHPITFAPAATQKWKLHAPAHDPRTTTAETPNLFSMDEPVNRVHHL
jgi:hypothetical protein